MTQPLLPGFEAFPRLPNRTERRPPGGVPVQPSADDLVRAYLCRLAAHGAAPKAVGAYRYQLGATVRAARRISGRFVTALELFQDAPLLGRALVDDGAIGGGQLSRWTLAQRRSAVRSFANLMHPELAPLLAEEPGNVVDRALRGAADRVGGGYQLPGGAPRRRGGFAPDREEVAAILEAVGGVPGFAGPRDRTFLRILVETGSRVNALLRLDGADCIALPGGRLRLFLHEKGKAEQREVELGAEAARGLQSYADAFNLQAAARRLRARVRLGEPGPVWRTVDGRRWGYASVAEMLRGGCAAAGVDPCSPHALRRSFASDAASRLPRHVVALAGGWKGLERLDDHYVRPREPTIWEKLAWRDEDSGNLPAQPGATDAAVVAL